MVRYIPKLSQYECHSCTLVKPYGIWFISTNGIQHYIWWVEEYFYWTSLVYCFISSPHLWELLLPTFCLCLASGLAPWLLNSCPGASAFPPVPAGNCSAPTQVQLGVEESGYLQLFWRNSGWKPLNGCWAEIFSWDEIFKSYWIWSIPVTPFSGMASKRHVC